MSEATILTRHAGALGGYPHARRAGDFIYVSGTSSRREDNTHEGVTIHADGAVELDIAAQTRAVIQNIGKILQAAGASLAGVLGALPLFERLKPIVTTAPDVTQTTNLGAFVNQRGLFRRQELAVQGRRRQRQAQRQQQGNERTHVRLLV